MHLRTIYDNRSMLLKALREISLQKKQGCSDEELPERLNDRFYEKDIKQLTEDINRLPDTRKEYKVRDMLLVALWLLLYVKILSSSQLLLELQIPVALKLAYYFIGLSYYSLSIYLVYEEHKYSYDVVFYSIIFSVLVNRMYITEGAEYVLAAGPFTFTAVKYLLWITLTFISGYCALRMNRLVPGNLFKLKRVVEKEGLIFEYNAAADEGKEGNANADLNEK